MLQKNRWDHNFNGVDKKLVANIYTSFNQMK